MIPAHGNVVYKDFRQSCSGHWQNVSGDATDDLIVNTCCDRPKVLSGEKAVNVSVRERFVAFFKNLRLVEKSLRARSRSSGFRRLSRISVLARHA
jgi:hypothetical protein